MKKTHFFWVLLCLIYVGCQPPTTQTHPSTKNASTYYTEPVQLVWNPQILLKSSRLPRQTLQSEDFQLQSDTDTAPVWSESAVFSESSTVWQTNIANLDTALRYSLHLNFDVQHLEAPAHIEIQLNGRVIKTWEGQLESSLSLTNIVFNPENQLQVTLTNAEAQVYFELYAEQGAGKIFRSQPVQHQIPAAMQAFDADTGDWHPQTEGMQISAISIQDGQDRLIPFESNILILELLPGQTDLPEEFKTQYGAQIEDECLEFSPQRFCRVSFDLSRSPLQRLPELLEQFNTQFEDSIQQISFSSLNAMRTLALELEILLDHSELIASVDLNGYSPDAPLLPSSDLPIKSDVSNDWQTYAHASGSSRMYGESWWLLDPRVREAWYYSVGTGARAAYIDNGWLNSHPELEPRRFLRQHDSNQTDLADSRVKIDPSYSRSNLDFPPVRRNGVTLDHGIATVMIGFAERDNSLGTVGTAPNATVLPYAANESVERYARAVNLALQKNIHVIGLNMAWNTKDNIAHYQILNTAIQKAVAANVPVIVPAGNAGKPVIAKNAAARDVVEVFPCGMNDVICVGAVQPYIGFTTTLSPAPARRALDSTGFPLSGQENLWVHPQSSFNPFNPMVWAPSSVRAAMVNTPHLLAPTMDGTSVSCPFVTGVVALMKSRNPGLTPLEIRNILLSNFSLAITHSEAMARHTDWRLSGLQHPKLLDVPGAVTRAIDPTLSGQASIPPAFQENYRARPHIGLVEPDGSGWAVKLNESLRPAAPAHEKRKVMLQSVSDVQWANLAGLQGRLINAEGWSHQNATIKMGAQTLTNQQIELLKIYPTLPAPVIQQAEIHQGGGAVTKFSASHPFEVRIQGEHLAADLAASKSLILTFHHVGSSANRDFVMDFKQTSERLNNAGTEAVFALDAINDNPGSFLQIGQYYRISVKGPNGSSNQFSPSGNFQVQSEAASGSGFGVKSVPPGAEQLPINSYVYDKTGNRWLVPGQTLSVDTHDFVGIHFEQPIRNLEVKIGPVLVPIVDVLENLAVIGIPDDLPAGVHDAVIKASGQTLTLEQVVSKAAGAIAPYPEPAHVPPSTDPGRTKWLQVNNLSEGNEARIYLNEALIATVTPEQQPQSLELGPNGPYPLLTSQRNELRFEVHSSSDSGYSYDFELSYGEGSVFKDRQGDAEQQQKVRTQEGSIDTRTGLVYQERLWLHNTAILPVGAGDYWVKVYNLGADEEVLLQASNQIGDIQWPDGEFRVKAQYQTFYRKLPWSQEICLPNANCWCRTDLDNFCWSENTLQATVFNDTGSYSYAVDVYKGIYLLSRQRDGQPNGWGANRNSQAADNWGVQWLNTKLWKYGVHQNAM